MKIYVEMTDKELEEFKNFKNKKFDINDVISLIIDKSKKYIVDDYIGPYGLTEQTCTEIYSYKVNDSTEIELKRKCHK